MVLAACDAEVALGVAVLTIIFSLVVIWAHLTTPRSDIVAIAVKAHQAAVRELVEFAEANLETSPCSKCGQTTYNLTRVSPDGVSAELVCSFCNRKRYCRLRPGADTGRFLSLMQCALATGRNAGYAYVHLPIQARAPAVDNRQSLREPVPEWLASRIFHRDNGRCRKCGSTQQLQIDHIIPVSRGGATTEENLQLLCRDCNLSKGANI
jgi:5-methylcytosine-specific restriction endonuclease McrA